MKAELLEPFRDAAIARVGEIEEQGRAADEAAAAKATRCVEEFDAALGRLRATPISQWPARVQVKIDGCQLDILRLDGEPAALRLEPEDDEPWETSDVEQTIEVVRDNAVDADELSIEIFESVAAGEPAEA